MTLCRKCGKEIPDGEELCEDCKNEESQMDEAYLEELMHWLINSFTSSILAFIPK